MIFCILTETYSRGSNYKTRVEASHMQPTLSYHFSTLR